MINDERAAEGVDHLQSAALELIQAARAFLDVAEDLVSDRDRVVEVVATAATLADVVAPDWANRRRDQAGRQRGHPGGEPGAEQPGDPQGSGRSRPRRSAATTDRVQHIDVS